MIIKAISVQLKAGQPQEYSPEAIEEMLQQNKQNFKDNDSNNMSMDDEDLDAEISMIESQIDNISGNDQQNLTKQRKSIDLLNLRKSLLEMKRNIKDNYPIIKSESQLFPEAEELKRELIELES